MKKSPSQPQWDDSDASRVRILLECPPESSPSVIASVIESHGYAVRTCGGPSVGPCALISQGACALVDNADVVVNLLGATPSEQSVLPAVAGLRRCPAILAETRFQQLAPASRSGLDPAPESVDAVEVLRPPITRRALIEGIEAALRRREHRASSWGDGSC
jgi:hypothetical protein